MFCCFELACSLSPHPPYLSRIPSPRHDRVARILSSSTTNDARCVRSPARRKRFMVGRSSSAAAVARSILLLQCFFSFNARRPLQLFSVSRPFRRGEGKAISLSQRTRKRDRGRGSNRSGGRRRRGAPSSSRRRRKNEKRGERRENELVFFLQNSPRRPPPPPPRPLLPLSLSLSLSRQERREETRGQKKNYNNDSTSILNGT